jgi:sugar phosphate isomerase/epimerase
MRARTDAALRRLGRREFIHGCEMALVALYGQANRWGAAVESGGPTIERIGLELYTVRELLKRDFDGTLAKVAAVGYREVEFAGYFGHRPAEVRASLARTGLVSPSTHLDFGLLNQGWERALDDAKAIGHQYVVIASVPEETRRTLEDWRRIADQFNQAGEQARKAGLQFGYHNHEFGFEPVDGKRPYDLLLDRTDPALVKLEMDLYWITAGGGDPIDYFARYPGRFPLVHVKDRARGTAGASSQMVDVGSGSIDWPAIFRHRRQAGIQHYYVEHDEPPDPMASIRQSYRYLSRLSS